MAETDPIPPPESLLIRRARNALGLSPEKIVERMTVGKISSRYWRQIEDGQKVPPDDTYAHMAKAVGLTPKRLEEVGRPEAAAILREINLMEAGDSPDDDKAEAAGFDAVADLPEDPAERMAELRRRLDALNAAAQQLLGEQEHRRSS
jgi:transcriptional regulator with XRE-family HTH domain